MERSCSDCPVPRLAQSLCTLCNKWLCYQCTNMHQHHRPLATSQYADLDLHQPPPPPGSHCPDGTHQRGPGPLALPTAEPGPGLQPRSPLLMCHTHRQEPLELFCESCDLLCCSSCHLSGHKNHRLVHIGKALQDQQWLFESLAVQLDERRASVENTAKQVEDRLHGVKIMQRKAENQIKMAKMIMMNELNKRAGLLIEQLEKISEDFQQRLDDQLQGAIEICGQLDHVHQFVTWATTQHCRSPVLFSKELISLQMQQLLEPSLYLDSWLPVKIKFNWDASYWTKQVASLGQISVEGGNCPFPQALSCPSLLRPQPVPCLSLPSACQRGRELGCGGGGGGGYQACCQPQLCCLHAGPPQPGLSASMHKNQLDPASYSSGCGVPPTLTPAALHQTQSLQSCWDPQISNPGAQAATLQCIPPPLPPTPPPPPSSSPSPPAPGVDTLYLSGGQDNSLPSHPQHATPQPQCKGHPVGRIPENHSKQPLAELQSRPDPGETFPANRPQQQQQQQKQQQKAAALDGMAEDALEGRQREEHGHRHTVGVGVRGGTSSSRGQREERVEQATGVQVERQSKGLTQAERREEQQRTSPPPPAPPPPPPPPPPLPPLPGDHRDARRPSSLEASLTAHGSGAEAPSSRRSSGSACGRRSSRSQSIPAEPPAAPAPSAAAAAAAASLGGGAPDQYSRMDERRRRSSDGVIQCVARQKKPAPVGRTRCRGQGSLQLPSPLLYYKTEPDHPFSKDETEYKVEEKCYKGRNVQKTNSERDFVGAADSPKVPVVCLERLKVLVSRLPPHGRRQSDPLPAGAGACSQRPARADGRGQDIPGGSAFRRATLLFNTPPYTASQSPGRPTAPGDLYDPQGTPEPKHLVPSPDPDSDSEPELLSEPEPDPDPGYDPQLDSDLSQEYEPHLGSSSSSSSEEEEADPEAVALAESARTGERDPGGDWDAAEASDPLRADYQPPGQRDYDHGGPGDAVDLDPADDADSEADAEAKSGGQHQRHQHPHPDSEHRFQADDSDSDVTSNHPRDSQFSGDSDPELDLSEPDVNNNDDDDDDDDDGGDDEPQALRSDLDEGPPVGHRGLLIANPGPGGETGQHGEEMESEDFCAVCLIGGDLLCCDRCPKVFHLACHIPPLLSFPTGDWICTLCRDVMQPEVEYDCEMERTAAVLGLSSCDQRKCQRLTLLLFSNVLSAPFHEPVSPLARHYYQIIKRPMDLSQIRARLSKGNTRRYASPEEYVADVYLMFRNCAKFNYPDSEVAQAGRSLESFFNSRLNEAFPLGVFLPAGQDSDSDDEYDEAYRAAENGFPWPERREQSHRKRKRRHSLNSRKHHL
ncbi:tripartite motif-containing protein 66 [Gadus chalcogrammus]|uniref:tripartite motif-containing protein 66 n=1 Tax=Gadus chalcogrammus TaxID=1042646 RepID=UPI0024C4B55E|nr:tripartite motif-containing protein 66 [Gadus chalcogrammus]